jgi:hypothetical protein
MVLLKNHLSRQPRPLVRVDVAVAVAVEALASASEASFSLSWSFYASCCDTWCNWKTRFCHNPRRFSSCGASVAAI